MIILQLLGSFLYFMAAATLVAGCGFAVYLGYGSPFWYGLIGCVGTGAIGMLSLEASERATGLSIRLRMVEAQAKTGTLPAAQTPDPGQDPPANG